MHFNQQVIEEFRANNGVVGGAPLLLLTTAGAKSRAPRTNPAGYLRDGDRLLVFASNAGLPKHPDWFHNLLADPQATIEIGENGRIRTYAVRAAPLEGAERDRYFDLQATLDPAFRAYQDGTTRTIPVVALHPLDLAAHPERNHAIGEQLLRHHDDLRRVLADLRAEVDGGTPTLHRELLTRCLTFCDSLRLHHIREDGAFTAFETRFPELTPAVDRLRQEHHVVARTLTELQSLAEDDPNRLRAELERLTTSLEEHFTYEEEQLLPALQVFRALPR